MLLTGPSLPAESMRLGSTKIFNQLIEKRSRLQSLLCEDTVQTMLRMQPKYFPEYLEKNKTKEVYERR